MTFLNPFILMGLLAAGIPILLHLLNLRKLRTIEFSTLTFLKELQKTKIRRIKIRQWLLLILRTLLVILVVMAFARPTLKGSLAGAFGERAKTTSVLILDDSQSMTALDEQGERFQQAKEAALRVVDLLKDGDEVFFVKLSEVRVTAAETTPIRNFELLRSALQESKPSFRHGTIEDALRLSARLLASSVNFNKEIFVFSDFQTGAVASKTAASLSQENLFPESARFFIVDFGLREPRNLGVETVSIPNSIFETGKAFTVQSRIYNAGNSAVQNHIVSLFLNGERVAQKGVDIPAEASVNIDFTAAPKTAGIVEGVVELENDDLEFDNRRFFTLSIPARIRVLLVGSSSDLQFIRLALSMRESSASSALQIREVLPERLSSSDIETADVILFSNPRALTAAQADRLETFLAGGGGMVVFPGTQTQPTIFNNGFAEKLRLPLISGVENLAIANTETESFVAFDRVELRHPLFQGMFEEELSKPPQQGKSSQQRTVESPRLVKFARYQLPARAQSVITLSNGSSFLAEVQMREGRALLYCVAANPEWSDFPLKGLFVPLLHRSVSYLAQGPTQQQDVLIGEERLLRSRSRAAERWYVVSPTNVETAVQPSTQGAERVMRFRDTELPGMYQLKRGTVVEQKFAVNMHPDESKTAHIEDSELATVFERLGISSQSLQRVESAPEIQQQVQQARFGVELWKHFLIAALIVALVEMIVAREGKRELAAVQPSVS